MMHAGQEPLKIFVVENHADTLRFLRLFLEDLGHVVFAARNQKDALKALPDADCDVLISDIGLPDGDGWELMGKLRESAAKAPLFSIAMSGFGMNADRKKSQEAGFREHLLKPFEPQRLQNILEQAAKELAGKKQL